MNRKNQQAKLLTMRINAIDDITDIDRARFWMLELRERSFLRALREPPEKKRGFLVLDWMVAVVTVLLLTNL